MKSSKKLVFRVWVYFLALTGVVLLFLWMMQISFVGPYYEKNRTDAMKKSVTEVERVLKTESVRGKEEAITQIVTASNMCGSLYSDTGQRTMHVDHIGANCQIAGLSRSAMQEYIKMASSSETKDFSIRFSGELFEQGMYFYGKEVLVGDVPSYIFVNAPIELLDSTVSILKVQFGYVAILVFSIATIISFILARRLSQPISNITEQAQRLAKGDLTVSFQESDYTEVKSLSRTLNYATEEFRKTDELRRDLVANVSHDIKTPLTMIKAYAEMIQDISGDNPEMREQHLKVIIDESNHLERLVNDMLTLSKYESKVFDVKLEAFNLLSHVKSTTALFVDASDRFIIDIDPEIEVYADEIKTGQILYNYINNALKYAEGSSVRIYSEENANNVSVGVQDEGPGMNAHAVQHVWDRYYKIDKNYKRDVKSSGLGLSIVKAIAEATGSRVWVQSEEGVGTTFFYTLEKVKKTEPIPKRINKNKHNKSKSS